MAQAARDQNNVPTLLGVSSTDGLTPTVVYVNPATHRVLVDSTGSGGSGITSINSDTTAAQTFVGGTNVTIVDNGTGQHTINATAGGGGVSSVTNADGTITATPTTGAVVVSRPAITGDVSIAGGSNASTVTKINGTSLAGLATGILKNTTTTGVPSIAVAADFPTLNQSTTGNAATATLASTVTTNANLTGDVTSSGNATTVVKINGTTLSGLSTGLLKNTTGTGVPSIAVAGTDYQAPITLTTTGTSGAATFTSNTLNIPQYAAGTGTVTSVSVTTANGVSGTVATATTTPAISLTLGAITPTSVNAVVLSGSSTPTLAVTGTTTVSGSNTGDQTSVSGNAGTATKLATGRTIAITGDLAYTSPSFDGSANVTAAGTLATVNTNVGSFTLSNLTVNGKGLVTAVSSTSTNGSGNVVLTTSPTLVTPALGAATATSINGNTFTTGTYTLTGTAAKTLNFTNSLTLSGTDSTTMTFPSTSATVAGLGTSQTFTGQDKFNNIIDVNNAVTVTSNAGTVPVTFRLNTFTNSSAATMAITMATASAVDGQMTIVRIYDFSGVAQTIGWTNTENSTVSVPTTSNGSTTLPLTVGFMYNNATSKWRCIASA